MCTRKDTLAHILGVPCLDDVMNYNSFTTIQYIVIGNKYSMLDENLKHVHFLASSMYNLLFYVAYVK